MQSGARCNRSSRLRCAGRNFYEAECTNRATVDELVRREVKPVFDFRGDLDVEWAGQVFPHQQILDSVSEASLRSDKWASITIAICSRCGPRRGSSPGSLRGVE